MKYEHKEEKDRWYEYGPGKEFETKEDAVRHLESKKQKILTQISSAGLYKLYEGCEITETKNAIRLVLKYKTIKSVLW